MVQNEVLNFEVFGLKEHSKTNNSITYRKYKNETDFIEVFNSQGMISIDSVSEDYRMIIAARYECLNQAELTYLLTRSGRIKFVFTAI